MHIILCTFDATTILFCDYIWSTIILHDRMYNVVDSVRITSVYIPPCPASFLGANDLSRVREELLDVSHKWFDIGLKLQLSAGILECIRDQYPDQSTSLREMLLHWLKKVYPPPTWEGLARALESRTVREPLLGEQLRTKYCKTAQADG